ncbi:hypothetical protein CKAH01_00589 [Colletotrichum kahawae]|uniref:Uncharacterized protein n=1 Tax=Colletotrichum kahawae TaxID=34407 RepID=A0AAE0D904_COLKA|nr:hypothetical protein CKAH01_00589 [Colletotrichum kahawae]
MVTAAGAAGAAASRRPVGAAQFVANEEAATMTWEGVNLQVPPYISNRPSFLPTSPSNPSNRGATLSLIRLLTSTYLRAELSDEALAGLEQLGGQPLRPRVPNWGEQRPWSTVQRDNVASTSSIRNGTIQWENGPSLLSPPQVTPAGTGPKKAQGVKRCPKT